MYVSSAMLLSTSTPHSASLYCSASPICPALLQTTSTQTYQNVSVQLGCRNAATNHFQQHREEPTFLRVQQNRHRGRMGSGEIIVWQFLTKHRYDTRSIISELVRKHNSAIDNHIVMFGLIEERCITHYRMKFYDREKGPILSKLTLKWRVNGQKEEPGWDHEEGPVRNRKETPKRDHHEGPGRNHEERPGRNHHEGPGRNREERPGRNHHNGPERNHEGPGRNHEEIQKAREGPP
ncbi:hypothetical protein F4604DRAFT_1899671 [Suillus subluteus]|nr:hypothetical protein F4604DRAFT_1899671 [Suillus subluteus]